MAISKKPKQKRLSPDRIKRLEHVSRMWAAGMTEREIAEALATPALGIKNPKSGQPFSSVQIHYDIQLLKEEARERRGIPVAERLDELRCIVREVRRRAFRAKEPDLRVILETVRDECKLDGLAPPDKVEVSGPAGGPMTHEHSGNVGLNITPSAFAEFLKDVAGAGGPGVPPDGNAQPVDPEAGAVEGPTS